MLLDGWDLARRAIGLRREVCASVGLEFAERPTVKACGGSLLIAAVLAATALGAGAPGAEANGATLSPQALQEIAQVEAEIDRIEAETIERLQMPPDNQVQQIEMLGKL